MGVEAAVEGITVFPARRILRATAGEEVVVGTVVEIAVAVAEEMAAVVAEEGAVAAAVEETECSERNVDRI